MKFCCSCAAGLETILKKEIQMAGYTIEDHKPTLVRFQGDLSAIAKMNLWTRVGNKVFMELATKKVMDFDGLFALMQSIEWKEYIQGNPILVTTQTKWSLLTSTPTIQSIGKKAIVKQLLNGKDGKLEENAELQPVEIFLYLENNFCTVLLNTTWESLHKRGYKTETGEAPLNEALAAGLILLSGWKYSEPLYDLFCGSGTIAIEAALLAKNIAPGLLRTFAFEQFAWYDQSLLEKEIAFAKSKIMIDKEHHIFASDLDPKMIKIAKINAQNAWVDKYIKFEIKDAKEYLVTRDSLLGTVVSNPPYGLRLNTIYNIDQIHKTIAQLFEKYPGLHGGIITSYERFSTLISGNRKKSPFYNGGEQCRFFKKSLL